MEGKLIKTGDQFLLRNKEDEVIAITSGTMEGRMLSLKNCQAIENGYDFDEYQEGVFYAGQFGHPSPEGFSDEQIGRLHGFIDGFQKALKLLGDKKYTEIDLYRAFLINSAGNNDTLKKFFDETVLPTFQGDSEWDVEIETYIFSTMDDRSGFSEIRPKLDDYGCLILKRK